MSEHKDKKVVIVGGGPAGLTASYELCKAGVASVVLEKDAAVGGLSRTVDYKGYLFDIGGHRFYTKVGAVEDVWREVLPGDEFLRRKRLSRIYYDKKFFHYPLRLTSTLLNLGLGNGLLILLSYLRAQLSPVRDIETFEQWVTNRFGGRLYRTFFKTYTEKVWGISCSEITAEWAAQRIKDLSLPAALKSLFVRHPRDGRGGVIKTLIEEFDYPARGPGMMWERMASIVERRGARVRRGAAVEKILWGRGRVEGVEVTSGGRTEVVNGSHFISSMPVRELVRKLAPAPPPEVLDAAGRLHYRDFITVVLILGRREVFPDNWIYIHDPEVKVGRIQNFKNWSPQMVADQEKTCLGLEYFCFEGDSLWDSPDEELLALGKRELGRLGLAAEGEIEDGTVLRVRQAYPIYDSTYRDALAVVRRFLSGLGNLQLVGRNGMHKYNNQDHSMLTAMLAVKNILGANYDLWEVNTDQEYLEELHEHGDPSVASDLARLSSTQPLVPERVRPRTLTSE